MGPKAKQLPRQKLSAMAPKADAKAAAPKGSEMKEALSKMKKTMGFTSEADIEDRIREIEFKMQTESVSLKEEKNYLAEIKELKKNKPKVSQVSQLTNKLEDFKNDGGVSLKEQKKDIMDQLSLLFNQKTEIRGKLEALNEGRKSQMGDYEEVQEKRQELQKKIQE